MNQQNNTGRDKEGRDRQAQSALAEMLRYLGQRTYRVQAKWVKAQRAKRSITTKTTRGFLGILED